MMKVRKWTCQTKIEFPYNTDAGGWLSTWHLSSRSCCPSQPFINGSDPGPGSQTFYPAFKGISWLHGAWIDVSNNL